MIQYIPKVAFTIISKGDNILTEPHDGTSSKTKNTSKELDLFLEDNLKISKKGEFKADKKTYAKFSISKHDVTLDEEHLRLAEALDNCDQEKVLSILKEWTAFKLKYFVFSNLKNKEGQTILHWAAKHGHEKVLQFLINNKIKFEFLMAYDDDGMTALAYALENINFKLVELLVNNYPYSPEFHCIDNKSQGPLELISTLKPANEIEIKNLINLCNFFEEKGYKQKTEVKLGC